MNRSQADGSREALYRAARAVRRVTSTPGGGASLWTAVFASVALVDLLVFRWLHRLGSLDRLAALVDNVVFLVSLPGIIMATWLAPFEGHSRPTSHFWIATGVNAALLWPLLFIWLRHRRSRASPLSERHREAPLAEEPGASPLAEEPGTSALAEEPGASPLAEEPGASALAEEPGASPLPEGSRRAFIKRVARGGAILGVGSLGAWATWVEPRRLVVRRLRFHIRDLPSALHGLKVLHLTDLHLGPFVSEARLRGVVRTANALAPDLVALTGDYVHGDPAYVPRVASVLAALRPRHGVMAVLGNHDHWEGSEASRAALARAGVILVENRHVLLGPNGITEEPGNAGLVVGGVGDLWEDLPNLRAAFKDANPHSPRLLLCHNPDFAEEPVVLRCGVRVDLMLAGHTHGGQVRLPGLGPWIVPSKHGQKYARGLVAAPRFPVHVSAGVGVAVLPVRLFVPPEMTLITLISP